MSEYFGQQRLYDRTNVRFPARLNRCNAEDDDVVIKDFSPTGIKVFSTKELSIFDHLTISFVSKTGDPATINGYVVWVEKDSPCSWSVGVRFDKEDLLAANRIVKLFQ